MATRWLQERVRPLPFGLRVSEPDVPLERGLLLLKGEARTNDVGQMAIITSLMGWQVEIS
jgi:hypothetical protein